MTMLVVGPSSAGKSTFIDHVIQQSGCTYFGYQLQEADVPQGGVIHYNLLHRATSFSPGSLLSEWDLFAEPIFAKIINSRAIKKAVVIVAPIVELQSRARSRGLTEPLHDTETRYDNALWLSILETVDHFAIYERLFSALEAASIPFEVCYSSSSISSSKPIFLPSDRVYTHLNLRGRYVSPPASADVERIVSMPGCEYQETLLPTNRSSMNRGYDHVSSGRGGTFEQLRDRSFRRRSILDVGCALGDMLFRAERFGATRLVGVEMRSNRYEAAKAIAALNYSSAEFIRQDFLESPLTERFDDVLLLNVLHHIADFKTFITKAAELTNERLIVEYPTFNDPLFQSLSAFEGNLNGLSVVGVSSKKVDQTFVFTGTALERLVRDVIPCESHFLPSPIAGREIAIFKRAA